MMTKLSPVLTLLLLAAVLVPAAGDEAESDPATSTEARAGKNSSAGAGTEDDSNSGTGAGAEAGPGAGTFQAFLDRARAAPADRRQTLVDSLWSSIAATPLIEAGNRVHFLYRGEAGRMNLPGDFNSWDKNAFPMFRLDGTDLWYYTREFEPDARLDYKFVVDGSRWILDPANPLTCTGGFGPNSELRMPGYVPPPEIEEYPDIPHGTLEETSFHSVHLENRRTIQIYLPPGYDAGTGATDTAADAGDAADMAGDAAGITGRRYPLILFHDGLEYVSLARADRVLDYLIHHGRIEPTVAVFVPPVDRRGEYVGGRRADFTRFIIDELIPWVDRHYRTDPRPERRAVMGASNGGDISLWLGASRPEVFGHVGAQSTTIKDDVYDLFRNDPRLDLTLYLDLGTYDIPVIIPMVRGFIPVLEEKGYRFRYGEYPEGHSWGLWRAHIDDALELFFPAPEPSSRPAGSSQGAGGTEEAGPAADRIARLIDDLRAGSPEKKEVALEHFTREHPVGMVPAVIAAVLDTTISPRHGDTGWGRIYHQAATALAGFAETMDGLSLKERGRREYSFYDDVGTATAARRREVHDRWLDWWRQCESR
jgi:enterochelin esterase family protein